MTDASLSVGNVGAIVELGCQGLVQTFILLDKLRIPASKKCNFRDGHAETVEQMLKQSSD
jgi:hypothetical protein